MVNSEKETKMNFHSAESFKLPQENKGDGKNMGKFYYYFHLPVFFLFGIGVVYFFNFTVDDAYITYRYAEKLVNTGTLVFNDGEAINALTSPFHALLSAALFYITSHTVLSNKLLALSLLLLSSLVIWRRYDNRSELQLLILSLVLLPSCILVWTFGGLETPGKLFGSGV